MTSDHDTQDDGGTFREEDEWRHIKPEVCSALLVAYSHGAVLSGREMQVHNAARYGSEDEASATLFGLQPRVPPSPGAASLGFWTCSSSTGSHAIARNPLRRCFRSTAPML